MAAQAGPDSWTGPVSFPEGACTQLATNRGRGRMKPLVTALVRRAQRDGQQATCQPAGVRAALTRLFVPMFPAGRDSHADLEIDLIPITIPELLRLLRDTVIPPPYRDRPHRQHWSQWRRRHQYRARRAHQRWNAYADITP